MNKKPVKLGFFNQLLPSLPTQSVTKMQLVSSAGENVYMIITYLGAGFNRNSHRLRR